MSKIRTLSWNTNGTTKQLTIESDDVYVTLIVLAVLMVVSVAAAIAGVIINSLPLGLIGVSFAGAIYLLVALCIKKEK
jgi:hypothetical protein